MRTRKLRMTGMKLPWQMSTKTVRNATNVVRLSIKETNAETMVVGTRTTEEMGNQNERNLRASAIVAARTATKKKTTGRSIQN